MMKKSETKLNHDDAMRLFAKSTPFQGLNQILSRAQWLF